MPVVTANVRQNGRRLLDFSAMFLQVHVNFFSCNNDKNVNRNNKCTVVPSNRTLLVKLLLWRCGRNYLLFKATTTEKSHFRNLNHWRDLFSFKNSYSQLCIDTNGASQGTNLIQSTCDERQDDQNFQCDLAVRSIKRRRADQCWTLGELAS